MKMKYFICSLLLYAAPASACDVCGSSGTSQALGILPQYGRHFAGVQYQYRQFRSMHPALTKEKPGTVSDDAFHTMQVWGRMHIAKQVQVFAFIPYASNIQRTNNSTYNVSGVGDISFLSNATIIKSADSAEIQHLLLGGAGIKLPTGRFANISGKTFTNVLNTQPGTGSWDILLNANYTLRYEKTGVNTDVSYTITTANKYLYKYGNRFTAMMQLFHQITGEKWSVLFQSGLRFEHSLHDYDNYKRKWLNTQTGGHMLFATAGLQVFYNRIGLQLVYYTPIQQQYAEGLVVCKQKGDAGLIILF